ncbi:SdpI family protein [Staphylococcus arlettae]|uniref:SdpI family protein n=1 Tax=Staphylococcus arlettae TaxID=29378 RepID=UPI003EE26810
MKYLLQQTWFSLLIIGVAIMTWLIVLPFLPDAIPMQYNDSGDVNWSANKYFAFIISIAIMLFCYIITNIKLATDKSQNKFSNMKSLNNILNPLVLAFLYFIFLIIIFNALGFSISVNFIIPTMIGLLLIVIGNYLPKVPKNNTLGIINKWTKDNEFVWKKTHRLVAYIYIIVGLLLFILGLLSVINSVITISLVVILVLFPFFYSWYIYQKL